MKILRFSLLSEYEYKKAIQELMERYLPFLLEEKMFHSKIFLSDLHILGNRELVHLMDSFSFRKWYSVMLDSTIF